MESATIFGNYIIGDELGRGGMAAVYHAVDERTEQVVALKILYEHWTAQSDVVSRFWREAEVAQKLQHPNIVTIYEYGQLDNKAYIAMPFMAGGSLADYFKNPTRISLKATSALLKQIARGLDYAHSQGVVHRDLKLANILIDERKRPALADFGIAHLRDATRLTVTGQIAGTPLYMSPEQARGISDIDHRSDLYSFAVMAYLMTTGFHPFTGADPLAILHQHLSAQAPLPSEINPNLSHKVDAVLLRGLAKDRAARPDSATEFANDLAEAISGGDIGRKTIVNITAPNPQLAFETRVMALPEPSSAKNKRRGWMLVAGVLLPILFVFLAALFALKGDNNPVLAVDENDAATRIVAEISETANAEMLALTSAAQSTRDDSRATLPPTFTATPSPTVTPSLTITNTLAVSETPAISPTPLGNARVSTAEGAELRTAPFTLGELIAHLNFGTRLELYGRTANAEWFQTRTFTNPELNGWIRRSDVETRINPLTLPITWTPGSTPAPTSMVIPTSGSGNPPQATATLPPPPTGAPTNTPTNPPPPTATPTWTATLRPTETPTRCTSADGIANCLPGVSPPSANGV